MELLIIACMCITIFVIHTYIMSLKNDVKRISDYLDLPITCEDEVTSRRL